jgi:hypothetical protein
MFGPILFEIGVTMEQHGRSMLGREPASVLVQPYAASKFPPETNLV